MPTLVTGFGPFGKNSANPSGLLAPKFGHEFRVLEVSYAAVDQFVDEVGTTGKWDNVVSLGLAAKTKRPRLELFGRNKVGDTKDVRGFVPDSRWAFKGAPPCLPTNILDPDELLAIEIPDLDLSADAGDYLCNYLLFSLLARTDCRTVFIHMPQFEDMSAPSQFQVIGRLIDLADSS